MNPDAFPDYLRNPSSLQKVDYQDLQSWVEQHPYCQNLRYLLLLKSRMEGRGEQDDDLKMAAAYSADRTRLYHLLRDDLAEEQLDLSPLDDRPGEGHSEQLDLEEPPLMLEELDREEELALEGEPPNIQDGTPPVAPKENIPFAKEETPTPLVLEEIPTPQDSPPETPPPPLEEEPLLDEELHALFEDEAEFEDEENTMDDDPPPFSEDSPLENEKSIDEEEEIPELPPYVEKYIDPPLEKDAPLEEGDLNGNIENDIPPSDEIITEEKSDMEDEDAPPPIGEGAIIVMKSEESGEEQPPKDEIDRSIQAALDKLAAEQAEIYENDDNDGYLLEEEMEEVLEIVKNKAPKPPSTASFSSWLELMKSPPPVKGKDSKKKKKDKKKGKKTLKPQPLGKRQALRQESEQMRLRKVRVIRLAEDSLRENEEVVSETLAQILLAQDQPDKAIAMYERLCLKFPEKKLYFAAEIEKIRNS